jgi:hypothetical protein
MFGHNCGALCLDHTTPLAVIPFRLWHSITLNKVRRWVVPLEWHLCRITTGSEMGYVACQFEFQLRNETDVEIRDLSTRVSCGCLRATELEGKTLPAKAELSFRATVLPTNNAYNQKLTLGGITPDGTRREVSIINFNGEVAPPLSSVPRSLGISELKSGPVRLKRSRHVCRSRRRGALPRRMCLEQCRF